MIKERRVPATVTRKNYFEILPFSGEKTAEDMKRKCSEDAKNYKLKIRTIIYTIMNILMNCSKRFHTLKYQIMAVFTRTKFKHNKRTDDLNPQQRKDLIKWLHNSRQHTHK